MGRILLPLILLVCGIGLLKSWIVDSQSNVTKAYRLPSFAISLPASIQQSLARSTSNDRIAQSWIKIRSKAYQKIAVTEQQLAAIERAREKFGEGSRELEVFVQKTLKPSQFGFLVSARAEFDRRVEERAKQKVATRITW